MKKLLNVLLVFITLIFALTGCRPNQDSKYQVTVGTIAGPETQLMEVAKQVALKKYGLKVKIIPFADYTMPNAALSDGSIDSNMFQHVPYLKSQIKMHHYKLLVVGKIFVYPMGFYSKKKITKLSQLKDRAVVAIPNDPSNEARALLLLQKADLIKLKAEVGINATILDITANPKQLQIKVLDAAGLPRVLPDVTLAAINTNYAIPAGLLPSRDALIIESKDSPYANVLVIRQDEKGKKEIYPIASCTTCKSGFAKGKNII